MRPLALFALFAGTAVAEDAVTLKYAKPLEARSAFEIRFSAAMVADEAVGKTAPPPLVIRPALAGQFVWVSNQSGVFTPSEMLPLSTTFAFSLPPDLKTAAGQPFTAAFHEVANTPGFEIKGRLPQYSLGVNATAVPQCGLLFNAKVDPFEAVKFISFVNKQGERVPARLNEPGRDEAGSFSRYGSSDHSLLTWEEQFRVRSGEAEAKVLAAPRPNVLFVKPAQPLPPGDRWEMVVESGLPGDGGLKLFREQRVELGDVRPFLVADVKAENSLSGGRRIVVQLSKTMADEVKADNYRRWFTLKPEPENLKVELLGNSALAFTGDFKLQQDYVVTTAAGLPAKEPFVLANEHRASVIFEQVAPVVSLETYNTHQLASGSRKVRINTVNVPKVRVTAKVFQPDTVVDAQKAYAKYFEWKGDEAHTRVEAEALPGRVAFDQEYTLKAAVDKDDTLAIDWNEIVGNGQAGVALVTVEAVDKVADGGKRPGAQAIIQLTDLGVVWKDSAAETFAYVFSLKTGQPVAGAELKMMDQGGALLGQAKTGADGAGRLPTHEKAAWLLVTHEKDLHVVEWNDHEHFDRNRFRVSWDGVSEDADEELYDGLEGNQRRVFLFSERPVYKPGETMHLKAIVRDERVGKNLIPNGEEVTLEVSDARAKLFVSRKIKLSEMGSLSADIALPPTPLGAYTAKIRFAGDQEEVEHSLAFRVEEYVPNAFEVGLAAPKSPVGEQKLELELRAKYYMGKPLSKAKVDWSLTAADEAFSPDGWEKFTFGDAIDSYRVSEARGRSDEFKLDGKLELEGTGEAKFGGVVPLNPRSPQPRRVSVRAEVTDLNQQTVTNSTSFLLHSSDYYLGFGEVPEVMREGDALPIRLAAVRTDGSPVAEGVDAQVRLMRVEWQTNRTINAGQSESYRSTPSFILMDTISTRTAAVEKQKGAWTFPARQAPAAQFMVSKPGEYLLEATAKDSNGHDVVTVRSVYVYGQGVAVWNYRNRFQIELTPDKEEYLAGEEATILVKTPIAGDALVTVERENVRRSFVAHLEGNAPSVKVPIEAGDAPNVYVSIMVLRGADQSTHQAKMPEYRVGYAALTVKRRDAQLTVYAKPVRDAYEPGQEVELQVEARDVDGHAVPKAEVTLFAVDEGVLSLMGFETPDPFTYFNERRALAVDTGLTLPNLLAEDEEELEFSNKGYLVGDGGEESAVELRKNFVACAYWNASLVTDADGKVSVRFKAPDSLTRYRVMAVVQTARDQYGNGESAFEINKPVMVEAAPPRFGNVGDQLFARAVIHNTTEQAGEAVVTLELDATTTSPEPLTRTVPLPAKASLAVDFPVEFKETGEAVWKWSVNFSAKEGAITHRDAMESRLRVSYPAPSLRQVLQGRAPAGQTNLLAGLDPALLDGVGVVQVRLSNSRLLDMREGLNQLLHYPYGCVEQTTSSTLPWLSLRDLGPVLPELTRSEAEVNGAIRFGVDRLFSMQTAGGGLAYWPGDTQPLLYASAWGGFGIAWARKAGVTVPEQDFDRLMKYLSSALRGTSDAVDQANQSSQCLALLTLALGGKAEPAYHEIFFKKRAALDAQQRAWLALAIMEAKGPREMVKTLLEETQPAKVDNADWWCAARTPATQLMAWCRYAGESAGVDKSLTALMGTRRRGHWYTTQGNAWAVLALGEYVQRVEKQRAPEAGVLLANGQKHEFQLGDKDVCWTKEFPIRRGELPKLIVTHNGKGPLFTDVTVEVRPSKMPIARSDRGYAITRRYQLVDDEGKLQTPENLKVGDRVLVTLDVSVPNRAEYLAIEDPLPANFEAINPNFESQSAQGEQLAGTPWQCDFHELRTDRALFFVNETYQGRFYIRYLARVRAAGTATAPAAKVEEMYEPDRFATTTTGVMKTAKWD